MEHSSSQIDIRRINISHRSDIYIKHTILLKQYCPIKLAYGDIDNVYVWNNICDTNIYLCMFLMCLILTTSIILYVSII